ncbi:hypothetical protein C6P44_003557 [Monosporozyma unispora]|nr:hypothetical protein C6P44_003557 [Kazachstania unispora]
MSSGPVTLCHTVNLIQDNNNNNNNNNNNTVESDLSISIFPNNNKGIYSENNKIHTEKEEVDNDVTVIIFDLTKDGQQLPKLLSNINIGCFKIVHLPIPHTLVKRTNTTFQNILHATMDNDQIQFLDNLIKNNSQYVFYDGKSTLTNCQMATFWTIEKFFKYVKEFYNKNVQIMVYEPNNLKLTSKSSPLSSSSPGTITKPHTKRQFNLSLRLPYKTKKSSDAFIESLKEELVQYSPGSLLNYFHLKSMDILGKENDLEDKLKLLPVWLRQIIDIKDERAILSTLWTKFNILEHLEKMRLKSCIVDNTTTTTTTTLPTTSINNNISKKKEMLPPTLNNTTQTEQNKKNDNIYSLSILQKQFKKQQHIEHNFTKLKVSIPPPILANTCSNNTSNSPSSSSADSDVLPTPLFNYEFDKAIQQFQKNRYSNILPYEHSRVKLDHSDDYFNANYINLPQINDQFQYIATQAPLTNTINDFWEMVWNENVKVIISLNSDEELRLRKWDVYWEDELDPKTNINVKLLKQWDNFCEVDGITLRQFHLTKISQDNKRSEEHTIYQLQYAKWLDSCVVKIDDVLKLYRIRSLLSYDDESFISQVESFNGKSFTVPPMVISSEASQRNKNIPLLVHCSAGCGRTGVFITLDYILNIFRKEINSSNKIDVWNMEDDLLFIIVNELRKQRISMVQNLAQYIACYDEIIQYFIILIRNSLI